MSAPTSQLQLPGLVGSDPGGPILCSEGLRMRFGGVLALDGVDINVPRGAVFGLIGPNGSGKSTWVNCISGVQRPSSGRVTFRGRDVTGWAPHRMYRMGLGRTFQRLENFPGMSLMDNMLLSLQESRGNLASRLFSHVEPAEREHALSLLEFMGIAALRNEQASTLSYGQQKLADLAMALMADPELVILDEPMAGVNPALIEQLVERIKQLNVGGTTFVIIEHNLNVVMDLCPWLVVLDHGAKIAEGRPAEIQANEDVLEAYFGR